MDLFFLIVFSIVIYHIYMSYKIEKMADTSTVSDQIKQAVKDIYLADVESIRNLSEVATKLQAAGLTIPGALDVKGNTTINGVVKAGSMESDGDLNFPGNKNQWIIHTPDDDRRSLWIAPGTKDKEYGNWNWGRSLNIDYDGNVNIGGNQTVNGEIYTPNGHTFRCAGRQHMTGGELLYLLHKNGVVIGQEWGGNGNLSVQGNLSVGGVGMRTWIINRLPDSANVVIKDPEGSEYDASKWILGIIGMNQDVNRPSIGRIELYTYVGAANKWYIRSDTEGPADKTGVRIIAMPINFFDKAWGRSMNEHVNWQ